MNPRYIICDTETAGLDPPKVKGASGVAEIGAIEIDPDTLEVIDTFSSMVNPGVPIHPKASEVNGIYDDDVKDAKPLHQVYWLTGPVIHCGHAANFDLKFVGHCYENLVGTFCTLQAARTHLLDAPNHKLQTLAEFYTLEKGEAHRALGDCFTTLSLIKLLVGVTDRPLTQLVGAQKQATYYLHMPFGMHKGTLMKDIPLPYIRWFEGKEIDDSLRKTFDQELVLRGTEHDRKVVAARRNS